MLGVHKAFEHDGAKRRATSQLGRYQFNSTRFEKNMDEQFNIILSKINTIREVCINKTLPLHYDENEIQSLYALCVYSIIIELSGDCCQGLSERKDLSSHVLTRALLEAVVDLINIIKNPEYVNSRFQRALKERRKKVDYLKKNPDLVIESGHDVEYLQSIIKKIDELLDSDSKPQSVKDRFKNADMEDYYDTAYSLLCDYSHLDASTLINRQINLKNQPLDNQGILFLSDLIVDLLLKSTVSLHDFLNSKQIEDLNKLRSNWQVAHQQYAASTCSEKQI